MMFLSFGNVTVTLYHEWAVLSREKRNERGFSNRPNHQLKKFKNRMFDDSYRIWYNIITEGASEMNKKE